MKSLANIIAEAQNLSKADSSEAARKIGQAIADALVSGEDVNIPSIGKLAVKATPERTGRNPKTGEAMSIPAGRKVNLSVTAPLKVALKG